MIDVPPRATAAAAPPGARARGASMHPCMHMHMAMHSFFHMWRAKRAQQWSLEPSGWPA
eukprot:SAG22_NODE_425_length_10628_cov_3.420458_3_plen_59_part_00